MFVILQQNGKLFTAGARNHDRFSRLIAQVAGTIHQNPITHLMAIRVIAGFEVVDVENGD